jgi:outer membrane protein
VSWSGNSRTILTGEDDFGQPVRLDDPLTFRSSSASQGVSSSVTLFDGLWNLNTYRAARASARVSEAAVESQLTSVEAEVTRRFYNAVNARRLTAVEEQLLEVSRRQLDATERLFRVAARTEVDVLGARVQVAQHEQALERARGDAEKALLRLAEQIGLEEDIAFDVSGALPAPFDPGILDDDMLVARAMTQSPAVAQAEADAARAGFQASAARGRRWPTVSARASFGRTVSLSSYDALFEFDPQDRSFAFGVDVQIPLFTGFQTSQAVAQATASERAAEETLRETRLQLERDVRSGHIDLVTAHRRLELAQRSVEFSRRRLTMAQEQYQLGTIGFTDFQQIVTQASQDARNLLSAEAEFATATVTLEELMGERVRPVPDDR